MAPRAACIPYRPICMRSPTELPVFPRGRSTIIRSNIVSVPITLGAELDAEIHEPFTNRPAFEQARFSLFFVHQPRAIEPIYGDLAWRFSLLEAGAHGARRRDFGVALRSRPLPHRLARFCAGAQACCSWRMGKSCCTLMSEDCSKCPMPPGIGRRASYDGAGVVERSARSRRQALGRWCRSALQRPQGHARQGRRGAAGAAQDRIGRAVEGARRGASRHLARIPPGPNVSLSTIRRSTCRRSRTGIRTSRIPTFGTSRHTRAFCISGWRSTRNSCAAKDVSCSMPRERLTPISSRSLEPFRSVTIRNRFGTRWRRCGGSRAPIW